MQNLWALPPHKRPRPKRPHPSPCRLFDLRPSGPKAPPARMALARPPVPGRNKICPTNSPPNPRAVQSPPKRARRPAQSDRPAPTAICQSPHCGAASHSRSIFVHPARKRPAGRRAQADPADPCPRKLGRSNTSPDSRAAPSSRKQARRPAHPPDRSAPPAIWQHTQRHPAALFLRPITAQEFSPKILGPPPRNPP